MSGPRVHVVGAGLSGLAAAVGLAKAGRAVSLYDAAGHGGGRCRSFHDPTLDRRIDNGNHLLLSGNRAALAYLSDIGAVDSLTGPDHAVFPFLDLATGERWQVAPNGGVVPWWIFCPSRRVPGSGPGDYLGALKLAWTRPEATVADVLGPATMVFKRFWEPLAVAVLNTEADVGAAALLWPVVRDTFGRGAAACRPLIASEGLSESFVDPAMAFLAGRGADIRLNQRLRMLAIEDGRVSGLDFASGPVPVATGEAVVLAVAPGVAADLVPELAVPDDSRAIVNGHFLLDGRVAAAAGTLSFLGLVGGWAQWLFVRGGIASVTVSAAGALADRPSDEIAAGLWREVARALDLGDAPLPAHRIVKEKRASFAQTPEQVKRRPGARTAWRNLFLAGDWTDTGLPATIEGSVRSGNTAARCVLSIRSNA